MTSLTKIINLYILIISVIVIVSQVEKNTELEYCDTNQYCGSCTICGNETNDYKTCSYFNLFCKEKSTNHTNFQESYLQKYSTFFRNISNANEFCGQEKYTLDSITNSFSIINKSNINIINSNINHCNYEIHNTKYFNNQSDTAYLIIQYNTNNPEKKNLKLIFNIFLKNSNSNSSKLMTIKETDLIKEFNKIKLNNYDNIIILLDFYIDNEANTDINEYIEIKIDIENLNNKKSRLLETILIVVFSVLGVSVMTAINIICFRRKQIRNIQEQNEILQQEELKRRQKIEKINKLFETILISKEFNEKEITNDCTECAICLEKFVNNCLVCVTPCKHVFHYECLSNFAETVKRKQKPVIKCPLCKFDFLGEENDNINNQNNNIVVNNNENINNENNNNENINNENINNENINNEDVNNESYAHQNRRIITRRTINADSSSRHDPTTEENLRKYDI